MEKRSLGRTGHKSTILALGGALFIGKPRQREVDTLMEHAFDRGVNQIDVAPTYGDAELGLGRWVRECRGAFFLACKTMKRTRKDLLKNSKRVSSVYRLTTSTSTSCMPWTS